jgi:hypothetical protein
MPELKRSLELFDVHFLRLRSLSEWEELSEESLSKSEGNLKRRTGTGTFCRSSGFCVSASPAASDKVYQLLAHGRWFSTGTSASSTTKTGRHDIAEILLKVALRHQK